MNEQTNKLQQISVNALLNISHYFYAYSCLSFAPNFQHTQNLGRNASLNFRSPMNATGRRPISPPPIQTVIATSNPTLISRKFDKLY